MFPPTATRLRLLADLESLPASAKAWGVLSLQPPTSWKIGMAQTTRLEGCVSVLTMARWLVDGWRRGAGAQVQPRMRNKMTSMGIGTPSAHNSAQPTLPASNLRLRSTRIFPFLRTRVGPATVSRRLGAAWYQFAEDRVGLRPGVGLTASPFPSAVPGIALSKRYQASRVACLALSQVRLEFPLDFS